MRVVVMWLWAGWACGMGGLAWGEPPGAVARQWQQAGISAEFTLQFINNSACGSSALYRRSCEAAMQAANELFSHPVPRARHRSFEDQLRDLELKATTEIPIEWIRATAINAHLQTFDLFSLIEPREPADARGLSSESEFVGIGIFARETRSGELFIEEVYDHSPAQAAGLKAGDRVIAIAPDGENFETIPSQNAILFAVKLLGPPDTIAGLRVIQGGQEKIFSIRRASVHVRDLLVRRLENDLGYILVREFGAQNLCETFRTELTRLQEQRPLRGLVLDLRGNMGGLVHSAICIGAIFLGQKPMIESRSTRELVPSLVKLMGRSPRAVNFWKRGLKDATEPNLPLVVLIDSRSASSSEILAGALQDHKRAWVVGERSFGKGTTQVVQEVSSNNNLLVRWTTDYFYRLNGRPTHRLGITPNFERPSTIHWFTRRLEDVVQTRGLAAPSWQEPEDRIQERDRLKACADQRLSHAQFENSLAVDSPLQFALEILKCQ